MKRLLAGDRRTDHPCWVVIDEVHALKHLPALSTTIVEGRKYGVKMVLGTQNKAQFEEHYGRGAATMLASSHVKILFRCNEPESARWVADMIGEEEKERPRIGTTATVQANGRDSINYSTFTERRSVVSKEQIMGLKDMHGYWKYSDVVVPFRIERLELPCIAPQFMPRLPPPRVRQLHLPEPGELPTANWPGRTVYSGEPDRNRAGEIPLEPSDDLDLKF
jgi:hypothetical protein